MQRIAPSARLKAQIAELLGDELAMNGEKLAELGRLGARLVVQRALEDEGDRLPMSGPLPARAQGGWLAGTVKLRSGNRFPAATLRVGPPWRAATGLLSGYRC